MERNPYLRGARPSRARRQYDDVEIIDTIGNAAPMMHFNFSPQQLNQMLQAHAKQAVAATQRKPALTGLNLASLLAGGTRAPSGAQVPHYPGNAPNWDPKRMPSVPFGVDSGSVLITAGSSATITVFPQARCVPTTMSLTELVAEQFAGANLVVGVQPLLVTTGTISLSQFVQNSTLPTFQRIMLTPGTQFQLVVTNITAATSARFLANVLAEDWREMASAA